MQPPRQEIEEEHSKGGSRKKVQFHKPNYFWDGGEKNITAITAPGMRGAKREVVEEREVAGRRREVPNKSSIIKVIKHVYSHKQIE